jgi:hypothetical protein
MFGRPERICSGLHLFSNSPYKRINYVKGFTTLMLTVNMRFSDTQKSDAL